MGWLLSKPLRNLFRSFRGESQRILIIGVDGAGKTTMLYALGLGEVVTTIPTIGFNIDAVTFGNLELTAWDIGGSEKLEQLWRSYYTKTRGIVLVVDSQDRRRLPEARRDLNRMLPDPYLSNCPLLVFANRQDLPNLMTQEEIADVVGLDSLPVRNWKIQPSCFRSRRGLREGFEWLLSEMDGGRNAPSYEKSAIKESLEDWAPEKDPYQI